MGTLFFFWKCFWSSASLIGGGASTELKTANASQFSYHCYINLGFELVDSKDCQKELKEASSFFPLHDRSVTERKSDKVRPVFYTWKLSGEDGCLTWHVLSVYYSTCSKREDCRSLSVQYFSFFLLVVKETFFFW